MNTATLLAIHGTVVVSLVLLASRKYKTLLNPVSFFGAYFFVASVLSPLLFLQLKVLTISKSATDYAIFLSALYFATFGAAYLFNLSPLRLPLEAVARVSRPFAIADRSDLSLPGIGLLALQFVAIYAVLMAASGAGTMWLSDTRKAYQFHRGGVGIWWSLCQAALMLLFLTALFRWGNTRWKVFLQTILFFGLAFFLGSKASMLSYPVVAAFYTHFRVRRIRTSAVLLGSALLLFLVLALQLVQRTADTLADALRYFDYFTYSARFIERFHHLGFQYGQIVASDLWYYVPRALYPEKPYVYGQNLLIGFMNPGFERTVRHTGFTPGMLQWSVGYADFGAFGVVGAALVAAWISKAAFEYFLRNRDFVSFALVIQLGFVYYIELFPNAPFPIFWIWFLLQGAMFWTLGGLHHGNQVGGNPADAC